MKRFIKSACFIIILTSLLILTSCNNAINNISTEIDLDNGFGTGTLAGSRAVDFYFYYPENWILHRNDAMITVYALDEEIVRTDIQETESSEYLSVMTRPNLSATVFNLPDGKYSTIDEYWNELGVPSLKNIFENTMIKDEIASYLDSMDSEEDYAAEGLLDFLRYISQKDYFTEDDFTVEELTIGDGVPAKEYTYSFYLAGMKYKVSQTVFINKRKVYTLTYTATENKYSDYAHVLKTAADTFRFK